MYWQLSKAAYFQRLPEIGKRGSSPLFCFQAAVSLNAQGVNQSKARTMPDRTTHSIAHFTAAFALGGLEGPLPPGDYDIDHDEELIEGTSRIAWRRVATFIHLPARAVKNPTTSQLVAIDHLELETALKRDRENAA
jgi:hypothetical protein